VTLYRSELLWAFAVLCGLASLMSYQARAGQPANAPTVWPGGLPAGPGDTLLMFVHPQCPCSRASLRQLAALLEKTSKKPTSYVVFVTPKGAPSDFLQTDLWAFSQDLPGVRTVHDPEGRLSRLFGTHTSGQVLLYNRQGQLRFAGGLTPSRGHEGDSLGLVSIGAALAQESARTSSDVYGCPVFSPGEDFCRP
jgi:hypothetical protein